MPPSGPVGLSVFLGKLTEGDALGHYKGRVLKAKYRTAGVGLTRTLLPC